MNLRASLLTWGVFFGISVMCLGQDAALSPQLQRRGPDDLQTLQASARLVVLDVVVTDGKGRPVTGLKASDFTLLEDGVPQKVTSFAEQKTMDPTDAAKALAAQKMPPNVYTNVRPAANGSASTVILMDALDTSPQAQAYLRQQMIDYMKTVEPGTQMAIFQLDMKMHMIQGMTSDPEALRAAASGKRDQVVLTPLLGGPYAPSYEKERIKRDILTSGIRTLAQYLSGFPGRKNLIWFTGAIPFNFYGPGGAFADEQESLESFGQMTDALRLNRVAIYPIDARGLRTDPRFSAENARPSAGPSDFGIREGVDHGYLDDVAEFTGGKAFYNTNGLKESIAQVVDQGSHFYTLGYAPTNKTMDSSYRKLKVQMAQQGLHLEYRRGYYAVATAPRNPRMRMARPAVAADGSIASGETQTEMVRRNTLEQAMVMGAAPKQEILFYAEVKAQPEVLKDKEGTPAAKGNYLDEKLRKKGYRNYDIHYSIVSRMMHFMPSVDGTYHDKIEYVAEVFDNEGVKLNGVISRGSVDLDGEGFRSMMKHGLGGNQTIALPAKGMYFLRLGVHDVNGNLMGTVEIPTESIK